MQGIFRIGFIFAALMVGCSSGTGEPEELVAIDGSYACEESDEETEWIFHFAVSGPAAALGSLLYIDSEEVENPSGYAMSLDGQLTTERLDFSARVPGTPTGETVSAGDVPFSCEHFDSVDVVLCATHEGTTDRPCWACGDDSMGSPPGGAVGWVPCN
jgi:hypothetical protein